MAFEKIVFAMKTWKDKVSGNTPVTAAELNRIEKGISDCAKQTNALGDSVSPLYATEVTDMDNPPKCIMFATTVNPKGIPSDFGSNAALVIQQNPGATYSAQLAFSFGGKVALRIRRNSTSWDNWKYLTPQ